MPRIQLLVVQPTPFCNIDCRYCYLPDRTNKAVVAEATLANLFSQVFASGWVEEGVRVVWHAGEPMVLPIDFYRRAFRLIDGLKPPGLSVTHSFQTNGTLIDDAWCEFFAAEQISVGVSIDGPQLLHDINRVTRSGRGTFDRTIAGIRRLRRHGVPFHVISVLSAESLAAPPRDVRLLWGRRDRPDLLQRRGERGRSRVALLRGSGYRGCLLPLSARVLAIGGGIARQVRLHSRNR